jgi:hypothetical protein
LIDQGWEEFCRAVLMQVHWEPGQPLVIDGIRHTEAVDALRQLVTPSEAEEHPIEVQVGTVLPEMADLIVDGARPVEDLLREMVTWIRQHDMRKHHRLFVDPAREMPHGWVGPGDDRRQ